MRFIFQFLIVFSLLGQGAFACVDLTQLKGRLYYTGLADNGWQVFCRDLATGKEQQLTSSPGDKRAPTWVDSMQKVVYKDALGQICAADAKGREAVLVKGVRTCAHFTVSLDGKNIYYTRLLANNPLRQSLWHANAEDDFSNPKLIFRMPRGSIRNVCISPSGEIIAMSHVWRDNEERLLLLNLAQLEKTPATEAKPITPELETAAFPRYTSSGKEIIYTKRVGRGNYDLFAYSLVGKQNSRVFDTLGTSEFYPWPSPDGRWLFYELRENAGNAIAVYDMTSKKHSQLTLPRPAKEPCFVSK